MIHAVPTRRPSELVPNLQRLKHGKTRLALEQPGSGDQRLEGRLSGVAGQMRQLDSMNEPGRLMPVAVTLAGFAADDRSRLNTRIPIFTLIFARGGLLVGAQGATGNEAVDVALAAILTIDDRV